LKTINRRLGKPSRFASPSLMGKGRAEEYVVSRTRRELTGEVGRRWESGVCMYPWGVVIIDAKEYKK